MKKDSLWSTMTIFLVSNPRSALKRYAESTTRYSGRPGPRSIFTFLGEPSCACNLYSSPCMVPDRQNQQVFFFLKNIQLLHLPTTNHKHQMIII